MTLRLITPTDLDRWGACGRRQGGEHDDAWVARILRGRPGLTPLEVSLDRRISYEDRIWCLLRHDVLGEELSRVTRRFADRAVRRHARRCGVPDTEAWARRWLSSEHQSAAEALVASDEAETAAAELESLSLTVRNRELQVVASAGAAAEAALASAAVRVSEKATIWAAELSGRMAALRAVEAEVWSRRRNGYVTTFSAELCRRTERSWQLAVIRAALRKINV